MKFITATIKEVNQKVNDRARELFATVPGTFFRDYNSDYGFHAKADHAWGCDASLSVDYRRVRDTRPDDDKTKLTHFIPRIEVGWSSTTFAPHAAVTAAELHRAFAVIACQLQAYIDRFVGPGNYIVDHIVGE